MSDSPAALPPSGMPTWFRALPAPAVLAAGAALGVAVVWALLFVLAGSGVPRGTTVLGVDIGGLSPQQAQAKLATAIGPKAVAPLAVGVGATHVPVDPVKAGLTFDAAATVQGAGTRSLNPFSLVGSLFGGSAVQPVVVVDQTKLDASVATVAKTVDRPGREGGISFAGGRATAIEPSAGSGIDRAKAAQTLRTEFLRSTKIDLATTTLNPTVSAEEVARALDAFGRPAVSGPVRLTVTTLTFPVAPRTFAPFLSMKADQGRLVPAVNGAGLKQALSRPLAGVERPAVDAKFSLTGGSPSVVASQSGLAVPADQLAAAFLAALPKTTDRVAVVKLVEVQPKLTTAQANTLGIKEKVASFTTHYPYAAYRLQNIHRAATLIDGTVLLPGQVFSLNKIVGERTAANGFAIGFIINNGKFEKDYGGGTSQVATTTFNAAFFAGLKIVTHKAHSLYSSRYPAGREATVAWPSVDLQFQNDSGHAVIVDSSFTDSSVTVTIWGTKVWNIDSVSSARYNQRAYPTVYDATAACIPSGGVDGFDIDVTRVFKHGSTVVKNEKFHTHYQPTALIFCHAKPVPTPSPTTTPSPSASAAH